MGIIHEEVEFSTYEATARIVCTEKDKDACIPPWANYMVEVDGFGRFTPREIRQLGRWLINEGKRLGREYKSNGAKK